MFESTFVFESDIARETFYEACKFAPVNSRPGYHYIDEELAQYILAKAIVHFSEQPRNGMVS